MVNRESKELKHCRSTIYGERGEQYGSIGVRYKQVSKAQDELVGITLAKSKANQKLSVTVQ
jgi:hypothetical protein